MNEESMTPENEEQTDVTEAEAATPEAGEESPAEAVAATPDEAQESAADGAAPEAEAPVDMEQAVAEMVDAAVTAPAANEQPAEEPTSEPVEEPADKPAPEATEAVAVSAEPEAAADEPAPAEEPAAAPVEDAESSAPVEAEAAEPAAEPAVEEPAAEEPVTEEPAAESAPEEAEPETPAEEPAPTYDYEALHDMNVHQLQEVAEGVDHAAVHGFSTMHKEELLHALCLAFGLEEHVHHEVVGIDKVAVKAKISALQTERDEAIAAGDKKRLKRIRRRIHNLKHRIRKATI